MASVKLFPQLAAALREEGPSNFRLTQMEEGLKFLEQEVANYTKCKKKYNFCYNTLFFMNTSSAILAAGCSVSGLVLLTSGPGAIVSLPLMGVGLAGELFAAGLSIANKNILLKLKKHEAITAVASAKLNSAKLIVSQAIDDRKISDEEFSRFLKDIEDFKLQKQSIQNATQEKQTTVDVGKLKQHFSNEMKESHNANKSLLRKTSHARVPQRD